MEKQSKDEHSKLQATFDAFYGDNMQGLLDEHWRGLVREARQLQWAMDTRRGDASRNAAWSRAQKHVKEAQDDMEAVFRDMKRILGVTFDIQYRATPNEDFPPQPWLVVQKADMPGLQRVFPAAASWDELEKSLED